MNTFMKKLTAILVLIPLVTACAVVPPEGTTAGPTIVPATVPTDAPTTAPTTAPTEPPITGLTPSMWMLEPEYPSYEALFSQNIPYSDYSYDWIVEQEEGYRIFNIDDWDGYFRIRDSGYEAEYPVPNTENFRKEHNNAQYLGCDGKFAYFYNETDTNQIFQMELLTGEVEVIVEEERIYGEPSMRANCVVYYIRAAGEKGEVCRLYIPDGRLDVLCEVENPEYLFPFSLVIPSTTQGKLSWYGLNPEIVAKAEAIWADPNAGKIIGGYDYTEAWSQFASGVEGMHQDFREMFFMHLEIETKIWGLERTAYDPVAGTYTKTLGSLDGCFVGSGFPHDHFNPVYEPLPVPQAIMDPWQELPGMEIQGTPSVAKEDPFVMSYLVQGSANRKLFLQEGEKLTLLLDKAWTPIMSTETAVYCLTDENSVVELSYDGSICNTLYAADNGTLSNFKYSGEMLCFREDSRVLLLDIAAKQYRVLMDDPEVYIEMWFEGDPCFCFSLSKGLYYQQYLFNIETGAIEETFIL